MSRKLAYDTWLFGAAMLIVVIGLVMIYSASAIITLQKIGADNPYYFMTRQCIWLIAGGALMLLLMHLEPSILQDKRLIYCAMAAVLVGLLIALSQPAINGKHRWIVLPFFQVQPAEFAKPVIVLFLASFLASREERINELTTTLLPLSGILALFGGLIVLEDFGTATTLMLIAAGMIFVAGIAWNRIGIFAMLVLPAAALFAYGVAYRRERLLSFLNPEADPRGKGFQALQSFSPFSCGAASASPATAITRSSSTRPSASRC